MKKEIKVIESNKRLGNPQELIIDSRKAQSESGWVSKYKNVNSIIKTAWKW